MERYRIESKLSPSTPHIFKVRRVTDNTLWIMKRIPITTSDPSTGATNLLEAQLAMRLHHPHIAQCEDVFLFGSTDACLIFTFYPTGDLSSFISKAIRFREPLLDEAVVMKYFVCIALALHFLHSHRIVHRDVKTSNILLEGNSGTGGAVLGDFGIAQVITDEGVLTTHDEGVAASGTPQYMAPELLQSGNMHSFKSDIWALGCVLYQLLCYRHPFEARDFSSLVVKVIQGNFPPVPQRYSRDLCELLVRLLDVDPRTRPNIDEILETPFVAEHVKRHYASVVARGLFNKGAMKAVVKRNFLTQLRTFGLVSPLALQQDEDDEVRRKPSVSSSKASLNSSPSAGLSPSRLQHNKHQSVPHPSGESTQNKPSPAEASPSHGRRAPHPVANPLLLKPPVYASDHEAALYLACREHDQALMHLRNVARRNLEGSVSTSTTTVKDTVDRVLYGPPPVRVERRTYQRDDSVASLM